MRAPGTGKSGRTQPGVCVRLCDHVSLNVDASGNVSAAFDGVAVALGEFGAESANHAQTLRKGVSLASLASGGRKSDQGANLLVRRLAGHGLVEYCLRDKPDGGDLVVIEPQRADYWPQTPRLLDTDNLVLSRFSYLRRRGSDLVLESPLAGALFRLCDPQFAALVVSMSMPQPIKRLRRQERFPGIEFLALLVDSKILLRVAAGKDVLRRHEGDESLVLWDFHDLLFHTRSTEGRHANPLGGVYPYADTVRPLPAIRPRWPGKQIGLRKLRGAAATTQSPAARLLRRRHSTRDFDTQRPITLAELARLLEGAARILEKIPAHHREAAGEDVHTTRPYPSAGGNYELEIYLSVGICQGLARGFYHYDADTHALTPIDVRAQDLQSTLLAGQYAMGAKMPPQILITIAARFGRMSWKYSALAYSLILKDAGVLTQTLYLMATDLRLGGCAIGPVNIDLFARMTGIEFHVEGPVGQFALGHGITRSMNPTAP
ncbi:MAG: SagB family peptide dehydrogenase [Hyphomicrobiales bacterium]|nr:SagB family peptide dehydrogenase [Hyphomicrobiales bacterium]